MAAAVTHQEPAFRRAQKRVLGAVMFCYFSYYTGRQTFGFAIPGIQAELGLDKQTLGWVSAGMLWAYAIGQAINGNLGDRFGGRRMMSLGTVLSFVLNWATSFGTGLKSLAIAWSANGLAQSMGWAPGSRLVANWFGTHERGKAFGFYLLSAGLSSVLSYVTSLLILDVLHLSWRWIFRLPVILMLLGGVVVWLLARDRPAKLGFADFTDEKKADGTPAPTVTGETSWQRYRAALGSAKLMLAGLAIGFQSSVRYGLLIWVPVYFLGPDFKSNSAGKWISIALPVGMALGAVATGWISDRFCGSRRSGIIATFMGLAAVTAMGMYLLPKGHWLGLPILFLCGFFAYGPQAAFWALAPDLLGRARAGTAVGVINCFAYAMAGLGEPFIGWMVQHNPFATIPGVENTTLVFPIVSVFAVCSALLALLIRR
ncbi:MFS transporter [Verrucomicrobium sp. BvORR034]|uniref:MFS transporter n=1 Tax=Verrucomicrobium sp. BvORR034 TaxID=1396418 RepID=UPI000679CBE5|nr:MFS transporter [Verrucomicrobium sp. BvORR034]